jgi:hypothetical protein
MTTTTTTQRTERERLAARVRDAEYFCIVGADSFEGARQDRLRHERAVADLAAFDAAQVEGVTP